MKNKFLLNLSNLFLCLILAWLPNYAAADQDPVNLLNSIANQLIDQLKANKASLKTNSGLVYSLANRIVVPHADLNEMSRRVLPPKVWNSATSAERSEFQGQFTTLLVRTYASALAEYKDQTIRFYPVRGGYQGKNDIKVDSDIIRTDGPSIRVSYRLVRTGSGWKLYDMIVEGVSMLQSFRSQFADQLSRGNMADVIKQLKAHNGANAGNRD